MYVVLFNKTNKTDANDTFPVLATQRLILRQLTAEDDQQIFALRSDNAINKYLNRQRQILLMTQGISSTR